MLLPQFDYNLLKDLHNRLIKIKNKLSTKKTKKNTAWSVMYDFFDFLVFLFENCRSKLAMNINPLLYEVETWLSLVQVITSYHISKIGLQVWAIHFPTLYEPIMYQELYVRRVNEI